MITLLVFLLVTCGCAQQLNVWPLPSMYSFGNQSQFLTPEKFAFVSSKQSHILQNAFFRYHNNIFFAGSPRHSNGEYLHQLRVKVNKFGIPLAFGVDESYILAVNGNDAVLTSETEWGALRGLETFLQLTEWNYTTQTYSLPRSVNISDHPRFRWRGLLIDSSRHFLSVATILRQIDALEANKMNVLHWHISDDQSFPLQLYSFPELAEKGAWTSTSKYSEYDVKHIVSYGYNRGVRVIPEIDIPGHTKSWSYAHPELFPENCTYSEAYVLNPIQDSTYDFLLTLITEISELFKDEYIHLGFDEVNYDCWARSAEIKNYMEIKNITYYDHLHNYFQERLMESLKPLGKKFIFWQESFQKGAKMDNQTTIFQTWLDTQTLRKTIKSGFPSILSHGFYLDAEIPGPFKWNFWIDTWKTFYWTDPEHTYQYNRTELNLLYGAEGCMWGEAVDDQSIDIRIWPRAAAIAERLWSSKHINNDVLATPRLKRQSCRLKQRGIHASPISPDFCFLPTTIKKNSDRIFREEKSMSEFFLPGVALILLVMITIWGCREISAKNQNLYEYKK